MANGESLNYTVQDEQDRRSDEGTEEPLLVFAVKLTKIFAYARGDQWSQTRYQF